VANIDRLPCIRLRHLRQSEHIGPPSLEFEASVAEVANKVVPEKLTAGQQIPRLLCGPKNSLTSSHR
jgi:hypothetical protein